MFTNHYVSIAKTLFLFILLISIAITIKIFFSGDADNIENKSPLTGVIIGRAQYIGSTVDTDRTWHNWVTIPVDTNNNGKEDILVLDTVQDTTGFISGLKIGWKVTFYKRDGLEISEFLPFLWRSVLDPDLPINTSQPLYISTGVYSTK